MISSFNVRTLDYVAILFESKLELSFLGESRESKDKSDF